MIEVIVSALISGFPMREPIKENPLKNHFAIMVEANEIPKLYWSKKL